MKAGIFFTGSGPIVVLTSFESITDSRFIEKLKAKGIQKFLAYEIPVDEVKEKYGMHFNVILGDLKQTDDLRVLDYNGHQVFYNFAIKELGEPFIYEP
ncbi:MAG: hypothetical protein DRH24_08755 [Deltaproteobacteria bacterium]|nr:MAG: hypothetical protein DRH24_08755 [Deltaproteobacteria bacterium]